MPSETRFWVQKSKFLKKGKLKDILPFYCSLFFFNFGVNLLKYVADNAVDIFFLSTYIYGDKEKFHIIGGS